MYFLPMHRIFTGKHLITHGRKYASPDERRGDASQEETAHKVAWSAVKKKYEKTGDTWTAKE